MMVSSRRPEPSRRLTSEGEIHWLRGWFILGAMAGIPIVFLVVWSLLQQVAPEPAPVRGLITPAPAQEAAQAPTAAPQRATPAPTATEPPSPTGVSGTAHEFPNVRSGPGITYAVQNQRPARGRLGNNGPAGAGADGGFVGPETVSPADNLGPGPAEPASPAGNYGRRQSLAGVEPQNRDTYDGAPADAGLLPRAGPEDMPGLLSAILNEARPSPAQPCGPLQPFDGRSGVTSSWAGRADRGAGTSSFPAGMEGSQPALPDQERPPIRHRVNPYTDVPSVYDLYVQVSKDPPALHRFGEEVFRNGTGNFDELPMDTPVGPDYVLGPGDGLNIELWGAVSQRLERMVEREGRVALREAGAIEVTGHTLGEVQQTQQVPAGRLARGSPWG